jgi:hypothetical protein
MEEGVLKKVNNCWKTENTFYLETSVGQNSNPYITTVPLVNTSYTWTSMAT